MLTENEIADADYGNVGFLTDPPQAVRSYGPIEKGSGSKTFRRERRSIPPPKGRSSHQRFTPSLTFATNGSIDCTVRSIAPPREETVSSPALAMSRISSGFDIRS